MEESTDETRSPAPNVDPTAVFDWVNLRDETMISPTERVLLLRTKFLARQNQSIMQAQEKILKVLNKSRNRRSSVLSAVTSVVEAFDALNDPADDMNLALTEAHETFVGDTNSKLYVKRTIAASQAAMTFRDYIGQAFSDNDGDHQGLSDDNKQLIVEDFSILNADLVTAVYIDLNKAMKKRKFKSKGKTKAKGRAKKMGEAAPTRETIPLEAAPGSEDIFFFTVDSSQVPSAQD
ncbi:hypothetical protein FVEN_g1372 [Fusarium venenatum]|uniref:Uncharacterized protein n=1 Tax=Fusarium venenatum TaxID=56646 RepID=A0A2L2STA6_9HYPO|nr:uncharacterized protein FVRRES_13431 [Fusarium venenatum]KAG8360581.1 hypothetical protein FVEN_g1372 [Fusarium venenatum]KAH6979973.1 hypothetical protein EDB82DRAFT_528034 [Fusarium venenatum]CEI41123.1 unnamed protein product [Fusarium venenatum]